MVRKILLYTIVLLLLADLCYSFMQHYNMPLDGDLGCCIVPAKSIEPVLDSPLGIKVFTERESYANPNRFFSHYAIYTYFRSVPFFFQQFTNPLDAAYISCALAKTLMQLFLIVLLSLAVGNIISKKHKHRYILAAALVTPLFQANGYYLTMGIIDQATSYSFFYALPMALLLLYFYPFYKLTYLEEKTKLPMFIKICWIPLALICCLSGPLNPGIALIISLMLFVQIFAKNIKQHPEKTLLQKTLYAIKTIPANYYFILLPISVFALYSLFLGQFNFHNDLYKEPLSALFAKLPQGLLTQLTRKQGFPILLVFLVINYVIIRFGIKTPAGGKIRKAYPFIAVFSLLYIVLLPFGGYRDYRPLVLRYDTFLPVTMALMYLFGSTTIFILHHKLRKLKYTYFALVAAIVLIFTFADYDNASRTDCEREAIAQIAASPEPIVHLSDECLVINWELTKDPERSRIHTDLLYFWGIINEKKLFYQ